jgi:hypothetical protein
MGRSGAGVARDVNLLVGLIVKMTLIIYSYRITHASRVRSDDATVHGMW